MELREFIKETLSQIVYGIQDAKNELVDLKALDIPNERIMGMIQRAYFVEDGKRRHIDFVEFEVALTNTNDKENKSSIGVLFASIGGSLKEKNEVSNVSVTNIKFKIPVMFP